MKIIDFERKGNVVRFYLGDDDCEDYQGDDWNDTPYEHNAGRVYDRYIKGYRDVMFPFDVLVLEPCDGQINSDWCKDDMKARNVPCIIAIKQNEDEYYFPNFNTYVGRDDVVKYYFGDEMNPGVTAG